jgi:hypothetical protein
MSDPYELTHSTDTWDIYLTSDGNEVGVQYIDHALAGVRIKLHPSGETLTFDGLEQAQRVLTALHAAVASIHKRSERKGPNNG